MNEASWCWWLLVLVTVAWFVGCWFAKNKQAGRLLGAFSYYNQGADLPGLGWGTLVVG
jgi:hypothetical protein